MLNMIWFIVHFTTFCYQGCSLNLWIAHSFTFVLMLGTLYQDLLGKIFLFLNFRFNSLFQMWVCVLSFLLKKDFILNKLYKHLIFLLRVLGNFQVFLLLLHLSRNLFRVVLRVDNYLYLIYLYLIDV